MRESDTACLCELQAWYSQPHHTKSDICRVWGARGMLREFYRYGVRRTSPIRGKDNHDVAARCQHLSLIKRRLLATR